MKFVEIKDKVKYDDYVSKQRHSQFLQSWDWGEFQASAGSEVFRYGVELEGELKFAFSLLKTRLPLGMAYFYCPRVGVKFVDAEMLKFAMKGIVKLAKVEKINFLRFEPRGEFDKKRMRRASGSSLQIRKTLDIQPSRTVILDLSKSEDELLEKMHKKTRYNIRLAAKKGVEVGEISMDEFDEFWEVMSKTSERDGFRLHGKEYYRKMMSIDSKMIRMMAAKYEGKILAVNLIGYFGDMATYVHGASSNEHRNLMAPFLLQWDVIKTAKEAGYKYYDFHGIDEKKWPGVTRFKKGFSGEEIIYPGVFDIVFSKTWYNAYKILRKVRRSLLRKSFGGQALRH